MVREDTNTQVEKNRNSYLTLVLEGRYLDKYDPDKRQYNQLYLFKLNQGRGKIIVVFKSEEDRCRYLEVSRGIKRITRKGGQVDLSSIGFDLDSFASMIILYNTRSYMNKRSVFDDVVQRFKCRSSEDIKAWSSQMNDVFAKDTICNDKDKTFKCFHHIHEIIMIREMAKHAHEDGTFESVTIGGLSFSEAVLARRYQCRNNLTELAVRKTLELFKELDNCCTRANISTLDEIIYENQKAIKRVQRRQAKNEEQNKLERIRCRQAERIRKEDGEDSDEGIADLEQDERSPSLEDMMEILQIDETEIERFDNTESSISDESDETESDLISSLCTDSDIVTIGSETITIE